LKDHIAELSRVPSITGFEEEFSDLLLSIIQDKVDQTKKDSLGNVIAYKRGAGSERLKVLLDAHIDHIGLMITKIEENGILRFAGVGGINTLALLGKRMRIFGKQELFGITGMKPPHLLPQEELGKVEDLSELFIDAGFSSKNDAQKYVKVGDIAMPDFHTQELLNDHFSGSAFDNRAGVLALLSVIDLLTVTRNYHDIYFLFAVQEEVGLRGAKIGGYTVEPEVAVVCDVTFADPVSEPPVIATGKGPVIGKGPNYYPPLVKKLCDIAKREDIPVQEEIEPRPGGTDAYFFQISKTGAYAAGVSIPLRYMHSQVEIINVKDIYRAAKLMMHATAEETLLSAAGYD
jgi:endoglucanase